MCLLDRYIIKSFIVSFLYCLILFVFIYAIIDLFEHLDDILAHAVPLLILEEYYISMTPFILVQITPIAALIATIYVVGTMNKHDEITAMRAAGINIFRVIFPFLCMGIAISILILFISEKVVPASFKNAQYIKQNYLEKEARQKKQNYSVVNNIALYGQNDRLIFIKNLDLKTNVANGITILQQNRKGDVIQKINAVRAKWKKSNWLFMNMLIYNLDENGAVRGNPLFLKKKDLQMEGPQDLVSKGTYYEFMGFQELSSYIRNFSNVSPEITNKLLVDLYYKISFPFTSLVLILIGAGFAMKVKQRGKAATLMGVGISIVIGFLYYVTAAILIALGKAEVLPPLLSANLANIIFGMAGILSIKN